MPATAVRPGGRRRAIRKSSASSPNEPVACTLSVTGASRRHPFPRRCGSARLFFRARRPRMPEAARVISMAHDHSHASAATRNQRRLAIVLALSVTTLVVELVGAAVANSLALLADAGHVFTDAAGITLALVAIRFAQRPATSSRTFGYLRLEILAAVVNAVLLLLIAAFVLAEAWQRLSQPPDISPGAMFAFALVGLVANGISLFILREAQATSLNMRGAYLEVMGDLAGSVAVIVAAVVIALTGWWWADVVASVVIGLLILPRTLRPAPRRDQCAHGVDPEGRRHGPRPAAHPRCARGRRLPRPARVDDHVGHERGVRARRDQRGRCAFDGARLPVRLPVRRLRHRAQHVPAGDRPTAAASRSARTPDQLSPPKPDAAHRSAIDDPSPDQRSAVGGGETRRRQRSRAPPATGCADRRTAMTRMPRSRCRCPACPGDPGSPAGQLQSDRRW